MADLSHAEKAVFEKVIESPNGIGYVLDFSDQSFRQFFNDAVGINIDEEKYRQFGNSKAKRFRAFISLENNFTVGKLLHNIIEYRKAYFKPIDPSTYADALKTVERLRGTKVIEEVYDIQPITDDVDFEKLSKSIIELVEKNRPEEALDRLHTFANKFIHALCNKHNIHFEKNNSLNSKYGKYASYLRSKNMISSIMTDKILGSMFQVFDSFNGVRNDYSFAHDNPLLNYDESLFIVKNLANSINFINKLETKMDNDLKVSQEEDEDDLPF